MKSRLDPAKGIIIGLATALMLWALLWAVAVRAHDDIVKRCFESMGPVVKLKELVNENGTVSEVYDRNGDGKIDIEVVSHHSENGGHREVPLLYIVDQNYDGEPDMVFIAPNGVGLCSDLKLYDVLGHNEHRGALGYIGGRES